MRPEKLYTAQQVRELDRRAIEDNKIPGYQLMQTAGAAAFKTLQQYWPDCGSIAVFCGSGNNGGDGFVLAKLAQESDMRVTVYLLSDRNKIKGDALKAFQALDQDKVAVEDYDNQIRTVDVFVDAMLGTGLTGEVSDRYATAIEALNQNTTPILSIDIPSGLNSDTGAITNVAISAQTTITFIGLKQGLFTADGPNCVGHLVYDDLNVPNEIFSLPPSSHLLPEVKQYNCLKKRVANTNKKHYGHTLVIGGNKGFAGAVKLAGLAAGRVGSGLVTIATHPSHAAYLNTNTPEIMCHPIPKVKYLEPLIEKATVIAIGPGLGQDEWAQSLFQAVLKSNLPLVVDADALNLLAQQPSQLDQWILTPHPGEASRLLNSTTHQIQSDRFTSIQSIQKIYGGICILKGAGSLVIDQSGSVFVCNKGNPGMATGGMGDLLTGVVAGLVAQGIDLEQAAQLGTTLHAEAGDMAAQALGERGLLATDLLPFIHQLVN